MAVSFDAKQYWNDRLGKQFDLVGVGDISLTMNYNIWSYKVTRVVLKRLFKKYTTGKKQIQILDIGSGTGFVVGIWKELGRKVIGVDIASTAINNLQNLFPEFSFIEFNIGSGKLPVADNSIGCCSAASVLYHIVEDDALDIALKNIHRVLEPGGIFIFSENFIHEGNLNITHQKCRSLQHYEHLIRKNGFEILRRQPNYVLFNDPVDSNNKLTKFTWALNTRLSKRFQWADAIIWPVLYPIELLLVTIKKESPAQEIMVCKAIK